MRGLSYAQGASVFEPPVQLRRDPHAPALAPILARYAEPSASAVGDASVQKQTRPGHAPPPTPGGGGGSAGHAPSPTPVASGGGGGASGSAAPGSPVASAPFTLTPSLFNVAGERPNASGPITDVTATMGHAGTDVAVAQPRVASDFIIQLQNPGANFPAEGVKIGPIQTIEHSSRVGIYRNAAGRTVERAMGGTNVRDAITQESAAFAGWGWAGAPESPWYRVPQTLARTPASHTAIVEYVDQPWMRMPLQHGTGFNLVGIRGEESFRASLTAKHGSQMLHLRTWDWRGPWDATVQGTTVTPGRGAELSVGPAAAAMNPIDAPETANDLIPRSTHDQFPTPADAQVRPLRELLTLYGQARTRGDVAQQTIIEQGILAKNPQGSMVLVVDTLARSHLGGMVYTGDTVRAFLRLQRGMMLTPGTTEVGEAGQRVEYHFPIFGPNALLDVGAWRPDMALFVDIRELRTGARFEAQRASFFTGQGELSLSRTSGSSGRYHLEYVNWNPGA